MYSRTISFIFLFLSLRNVRATSVLDLTVSTFDDFISSHSMVMVEFYAPWCGICQELEPVYDGIASELDESKDITLARVDCVAQPTICAQYGTPIYPTLRLFQGLQHQAVYNGARTSSDMIPYMERRYNPPVMSLSKDEIHDFRDNNKIAVIGFWEIGDERSNSTFTRVAQEHIDYYAFAATNEETAALAAGVERPGVALYKHYDNKQMVQQGSFEEDDIADFVNLGSIPLVGEYTQKWAWKYFGEGTLPFVGLFANSAAERAALAEMVMPIAKDTQGILRFATVNTTKHKKLAESFQVKTSDVSVLAIKDLDNQLYHFSTATEISQEAVGDWLKAYQRGELEPYNNAQPTSQEVVVGDDPVVVVDTQNFEEIVLDNNTDVLLEFYAPWRGHCKRLAPIYTQLAESYANTDFKVRIAKMDATLNKIPGHAVTKFPTLQLFPAGAKDTPITYSGDRSLQDLMSFLQPNGSDKANTPRRSEYHAEDVGGKTFDSAPVKDEL